MENDKKKQTWTEYERLYDLICPNGSTPITSILSNVRWIFDIHKSSMNLQRKWKALIFHRPLFIYIQKMPFCVLSWCAVACLSYWKRQFLATTKKVKKWKNETETHTHIHICIIYHSLIKVVSTESVCISP